MKLKSLPKNINNKPIRHYKTESNLKSKDLSNINPINKNLLKLFNYKLFKLNESNKQLNINQLSSNKELSSNIQITNYNNHTKNYNITTNYYNTNRNTNKEILKHVNKVKYFSPELNNNINKYFHQKLFKNKINKEMKFGLFPLYYLSMNKSNKLIKNKIINKKLYYKKHEYFKNNIDNDFLSKTNYTNNNYINNNFINNNHNYFLKNVKKKFHQKKKKNDHDSEENDMKPKIRFINLKKDLMEENLKINKMFSDFIREIAEKEKSLKFIGKHRTKNNKENNQSKNS